MLCFGQIKVFVYFCGCVRTVPPDCPQLAIMLFNDIIFPIFLLAVFVIYWLCLRNRTQAQNALLLTASYVFYGWWDWRFLGLIALTTLTTFTTALGAQGRHGRMLTAANIVFNAGLLFVFKYFNFFGENLQRLFGLLGINLGWFSIEVLLPVGISFYTFQAIAYSADVRNGRIRPCRNLLDFATFIAYFPQLVAGPIERASQLLGQIERPRHWNTEYAVSGLRMILVGVVKKVCVADMLAVYVDRLYGMDTLAPHTALAAGILFSLEIYFDFSGYCDIARGVSRLLGIELMANFRFPYFSRNIFEFWRRWHISLMMWFRDYIYIPLGGNRRGKSRTLLNVALVFVISGLWHGAAFNFIAWGAYWAVVCIAGRLLPGIRRDCGDIGWRDLPRIAVTLGFVMFGFYIFRCDSMAQFTSGMSAVGAYIVFFGMAWIALEILCRWRAARVVALIAAAIAAVCAMYLLLPRWPLLLKAWWLVPMAAVAVVEWRCRNLDFPMQHISDIRWERLALYWLFIASAFVSEPLEMAFIYFQF